MCTVDCTRNTGLNNFLGGAPKVFIFGVWNYHVKFHEDLGTLTQFSTCFDLYTRFWVAYFKSESFMGRRLINYVNLYFAHSLVYTVYKLIYKKEGEGINITKLTSLTEEFYMNRNSEIPEIETQ